MITIPFTDTAFHRSDRFAGIGRAIGILDTRSRILHLAVALRFHALQLLRHRGVDDGQVYRARDTKLDRDVAIKVLPEEFANDEERLARFEREAKLLASLNHPNIASIYGFEEQGGVRALALELVEGPTLAERIALGQIPAEESVAIAKQIADALEAGHEAGIIHRDLKPANIKLKEDGTVKVLDYGLAKALGADGPNDADAGLSQSPTLTRQGTRVGVLLGTAAYMSPEQARGKLLDTRTDIWSFGCVLYEALTGRPAFLGETVSDTLASVLEREPGWTTLPASTPEALRRLLRRCLEKDAARRLHHMADASLELDEALQPKPDRVETRASPGHPRVALWAAVSAVLAGLAVWSATRSPPPPSPEYRLAVPVPNAFPFPDAVISPDGMRIVYRGRGGLWARRLDATESEPIQGTDGASQPFFSPDGGWLGYFASRRLYKIQLPVSAPVSMSEVGQVPRGASWGDDDSIVYTPDSVSGLWRLPADGGPAEEITRPDRSQDEKSHRMPDVLPGSEAVLFTTGTTRIHVWDDAQIELLELRTGRRRVLVEEGTGPVYLPSGHILYRRRRSLFAVPFDLESLVVTGPPVPLVSDVRPRVTGAPHFSVSDTGILVYPTGDERVATQRLVLVDRTGSARPLTEFDRNYREPRVSPDGKQLAVVSNDANEQLFRYDMERRTLTQLTFEWDHYSPVWTADGRHVIVTSAPTQNLFRIAADGSGPPERLTTSENGQWPISVSPDGRNLAFEEVDPPNVDVRILSLDGTGESRPFLDAAFRERNPRFSPDGRSVAYVSDETGRDEIYLVSFPEGTGKAKVSVDGGFDPMWARNGRELFYRAQMSETRNRMMVVDVSRDVPSRVSTPRVLFEDSYETFGDTSYDILPDDQQFIMIETDREALRLTHLNIVLNWHRELERLVPTR